MLIKIYGLINPETKRIMYIGKTILSLKRRLQLHINKAKEMRTKKDKWILNLVSSNAFPDIILLEETAKIFASKREKEWIDKLGLAELVNGNIGGGGNNGSGIKRNESYKNGFIVFMNNSKYSKSTIKNSICYVNRFINYFKTEIKSPKEINSVDIGNYISTIQNKNTRNANIVALKIFYKEVMKQPLKLKNIRYEYF